MSMTTKEKYNRIYRKYIDPVRSNNQGVTLAETLLAVLILMLATGLAASCIQIALTQYDKSIRESEGQMLAATLSTLVESELHYAKDIQTLGSGDVNFTYYSTAKGLGRDCKLTSGDGNEGRLAIYSAKQGQSYYLVPEGTYTYDLKARVKALYDEGTDTVDVTVSVFYDDKTGEVTCAENKFKVKTIN